MFISIKLTDDYQTMNEKRALINGIMHLTCCNLTLEL